MQLFINGVPIDYSKWDSLVDSDDEPAAAYKRLDHLG